MKTYSQMAEDVFRHRDEYEAAQRKKKKNAQRTAVSVGCCIVAAICIGVYHQKPQNQFGIASGVSESETTRSPKKPDVVTGTEKETTSLQGALPVNPNVTEKTDTTPKNNDAHTEKATFVIVTEPNDNPTEDDRLKFHLNEITDSVAGHPLYRDPELHYTVEYSDTESAEYYGLKLYRLAAITPNDVKLCKGSHKKIFTNEGTLVEERSEFVFKGDGSRAVYIQANRLGPVSDCLYMSDTDLSTTFITEKNGTVDVKVYSGKYQDESETFFVADFSVNGTNYRLKAKNLTLKEFTNILFELVAF